MTGYPERLALAQLPTPIHDIRRFPLPANNIRLWVKRDDLTGSATSGNKIRKLEFTLAEAKQQGADVIVTCGGVQSNHARATAILAAQLGMKCHLLLRGEAAELTSDGNHLLDLVAGATIETYPSSTYVPKFRELVDSCCEQYRAKGLKPYFITTGASDATGVWGYIHASEEIHAQSELSGIHFDHIVCATGSGGTLAGLVAGNEIHGLHSTIWGINVCDTADHFVRKAKQDLLDWQQKYRIDFPVSDWPVRVIDGYVGEGYAKADQSIYRLIRDLAQHEGIILDPVYTGKAFHGLVCEMEKGRFTASSAGKQTNILFIHTGGLFGLFTKPHEDKLKQAFL